MRVLLFGATGMVGQGVLRECLEDGGVDHVRAVGRTSLGSMGPPSPRLDELVVPDVADLSAVRSELAGFDACFFCLGVSSAGMSEDRYTRLTYDLTLSAARTLVEASPSMTFVYVSGAGTDATERGRTMWARVKGRTENALSALPFRAVYLFRPALIVPLHGVRSKTRWYRLFYAVATPLLPVLRALFPGAVTTTEEIGRAMLEVARRGWPKRVLETRDIRDAAASSALSVFRKT
jgi:uncharacterized protein YbjT (DUF2867 family)